MAPADDLKGATSLQDDVSPEETGQAQQVRKHLWISGAVQGVWFRQSTKDEAQKIGGLQGWVCNRADGRVEVVVQGAPDAVARLVRFCRQGPAAADVDEVEVQDETPVPDERTFHVTR